MRKGCLTFLTVLLLLAALPLVWRGVVKLHYQRSIFSQPDAPARPVAIVFGAAVYRDGRLSPVLRDRVETAITLYHSGQVSRIIMSGQDDSIYYNEPGTMMAYAVEHGVDPAHVQADPAGHRTYDTCYRALHVFDVSSAVLVTQAFHLPRALMTCEGLGIEAIGVKADLRPYRDARWYEVRETAATLVAAWDVVRREPPRLIELAQEARSDTGWPAISGGN